MPRRSLDIAAEDGAIDCTLHTAAAPGPRPGVLMLTDIKGPRETFFAMADRLAAAGFAVLLPNIYHHLGRAPVPDQALDPADPADLEALLKLKATITPARMRADARAMIDGIMALPEVAAGPIGVVGYCMGGRYAIHAAEAGGDRVAAAASYHGGELILDGVESPHRIAAALDCALYFGHAEDDLTVPAARIPELDRTLAEAGRDFTSETYAGALHGFAVPGTPRHDEASAERHWRTLRQLLARALG